MKKILKYLGICLIGFVGLYLLLVVVSLLMPKVAEHAFFAPVEGEHQPLVFAHQGGEGIRPTNTILGFTDVYNMGSDVLDADLHMTSDKVLVLAHDETIDRTSNGSGAIRDMTLQELRQFDFGYDLTVDNGQTYPYRGQGITIPTLQEFFDTFPEAKFGIEIKQTTTEAAEKFCQTIKDYGYQHKVLVSSFAQENMDIFRQQCPDIATSATEDETKIYYIFQRVGLAGLYRARFEALQVPEKSGSTKVLTDWFVANAKRRGFRVIPWTINEEEDLRRIIDMGIYGINTNYPDRMIDILEN